MDHTQRFTTKAELYARYRWGFAPESVAWTAKTARLTKRSVVADIGSGTGMLTRPLLTYCRIVYAVEPNLEMRRFAEQELAAYPGFKSLEARAEAIPLPDHSVHLVTVGRALHWFDPPAFRDELTRILRPGGWLAIFYNNGKDEGAWEAMQPFMTEDYGWESQELHPENPPLSYYFGHANIQTKCFPGSLTEGWEGYFGAICSHSRAPDHDHPQFARFEAGVRGVFDRFSRDGLITSQFETEVNMGIVRRDGIPA